jgi:flagellar protein FliO/FliZ
MGMSQTWAVVVLFMLGMAALPWLVRRLQQRQAAAGAGQSASRVLSQVAVGPHQRVVTVQVQHEGAQAVLVLGVTAQQVQCLHVLQAAPVGAAFSHALAQAQGSALDTTAER